MIKAITLHIVTDSFNKDIVKRFNSENSSSIWFGYLPPGESDSFFEEDMKSIKSLPSFDFCYSAYSEDIIDQMSGCVDSNFFLEINDSLIMATLKLVAEDYTLDHFYSLQDFLENHRGKEVFLQTW